ncbi:hypothetical protein ES703_13379 [subsurface metagenome]
MVPKNINKEHILQALAEIDQAVIPPRREPTKYFLKYSNQFYPPKYVISIANKYANGEELPSNNFSGGDESNAFLENLGFEIVPKDVFSWEIISDDTIIKTLDRSAFLHHGTGIPHQIISFFNIIHLEPGSEKGLYLEMDSTQYNAKITTDRQVSPRVRLFWKAEFQKVLNNKFSDLHNAFEKELIEHQYFAELVFKKTDSNNVFQKESLILSRIILFGCRKEAKMPLAILLPYALIVIEKCTY